MSDSKGPNIKIDVDTFLPCIVVLLVFFAGDPDICDAIVHWLMKP